MDQLPERPSDAVTPPAPTLKIGPQHCKISVHMQQRNGDGVTVFLEVCVRVATLRLDVCRRTFLDRDDDDDVVMMRIKS